jgi:hypothetical protein
MAAAHPVLPLPPLLLHRQQRLPTPAAQLPTLGEVVAAMVMGAVMVVRAAVRAARAVRVVRAAAMAVRAVAAARAAAGVVGVAAAGHLAQRRRPSDHHQRRPCPVPELPPAVQSRAMHILHE